MFGDLVGSTEYSPADLKKMADIFVSKQYFSDN
jgi:hypothetical protein